MPTESPSKRRFPWLDSVTQLLLLFWIFLIVGILRTITMKEEKRKKGRRERQEGVREGRKKRDEVREKEKTLLLQQEDKKKTFSISLAPTQPLWSHGWKRTIDVMAGGRETKLGWWGWEKIIVKGEFVPPSSHLLGYNRGIKFDRAREFFSEEICAVILCV